MGACLLALICLVHMCVVHAERIGLASTLAQVRRRPVLYTDDQLARVHARSIVSVRLSRVVFPRLLYLAQRGAGALKGLIRFGGSMLLWH